MSLALFLILAGYTLAWAGIHDEGPFDEILRAFGHAPPGSTSPSPSTSSNPNAPLTSPSGGILSTIFGFFGEGP